MSSAGVSLPSMRKLLVLLSVLSALPMLSPSRATAAGEDRTESPYFYVADQKAAEALPLQETRAKVSIAGVIARVRVTQVYVNEGGQPIEAVYVFPGSTRAAVFGMEMKIGDRTIVAEIAKTKDARARYEEAKNEGRAASLLLQERPNVFRMNVANIMPGDRIEVHLDYTELLVPEEGVYEFVYPTVVGPRFTGESTKSEAWTANPYLEQGRGPTYRWALSARISAGMAIAGVQSPTHKISPRFDASGDANVEVLDEDGGNRDFILRYRLDGDRIETGLLLYQDDAEKFFTAIIQPPQRVAPAMIPPREYIFIVDVSGSMGGFPIQSARALVDRLVAELRAEDRFNLLFFAGGNQVMAPASVPATPANRRRARRMIAHAQAGGGTEILQALQKGLSMPRTPDMSATMVVVTDGYVSVENEAFNLIRSHLGDTNLFAFGIGSSVNRHLIEGLAREGLGQPFVVESPGEAGPAAERFRRYIESPVLTRVKLELDGFDAYDLEPASVPDLFGERPLVIMGKYRGEAKGSIRISGTNGQGAFTKTIAVADHHPSDDLIALRYLWARERIGRLHEDPEAVTRLGLAYHLMTEETSFVAVDSTIRNTLGGSATIVQPLPLPEGVFGKMSGTSIGGSFGMGGLGTGEGGGGLRSGGRGKGTTSVLSGQTVIMGSLDKRVIARVIRRGLARVKYCYEKSLARSPNLSGRLALRFVIGPDGKVTRIEVSSSTLGAPEIDQCVEGVLKSLVFPKPAGGGSVTVTYPFNFNQG